MDIIRGIIGFNEKGKIVVEAPSHIFNLKINEPYTNKLKEGDKLLGVIVNDIFNICYEFKLNNQVKLFGYIIDSTNEHIINIKLINEFDKLTFNPLDPC